MKIFSLILLGLIVPFSVVAHPDNQHSEPSCVHRMKCQGGADNYYCLASFKKGNKGSGKECAAKNSYALRPSQANEILHNLTSKFIVGGCTAASSGPTYFGLVEVIKGTKGNCASEVTNLGKN